MDYDNEGVEQTGMNNSGEGNLLFSENKNVDEDGEPLSDFIANLREGSGFEELNSNELNPDEDLGNLVVNFSKSKELKEVNRFCSLENSSEINLEDAEIPGPIKCYGEDE